MLALASNPAQQDPGWAPPLIGHLFRRALGSEPGDGLVLALRAQAGRFPAPEAARTGDGEGLPGLLDAVG